MAGRALRAAFDGRRDDRDIDSARAAAPLTRLPSILAMRDRAAQFDPRPAALARWTWPHTIARFGKILADVAAQKFSRTLMSID